MNDHFEARLHAAGVVPVVTLVEDVDPVALAETLSAAGLDTIEITLRTAGAVDAIRRIARSGLDVLVGAGTVRSTEAAKAAVDAGARFLVSPGLMAPVLEVGRRMGVPTVPGIVTPTELGEAIELNGTLVKMFPASLLGGLAWVQALASVYPEARFIPTGGIGPQDVEAYLANPNVVAVGGSWITSQRRPAGALTAIAAAARDVHRSVRAIRTPSHV